jgi:hypothetical protein
LVTGRFGVQASSAAPVRLSDSDAIDLALGAPFHLNDRKPILDARSVGLERGGGFYYDKCVAIRTRQGIAVFLIAMRRDHSTCRILSFMGRTPSWRCTTTTLLSGECHAPAGHRPVANFANRQLALLHAKADCRPISGGSQKVSGNDVLLGDAAAVMACIFPLSARRRVPSPHCAGSRVTGGLAARGSTCVAPDG